MFGGYLNIHLVFLMIVFALRFQVQRKNTGQGKRRKFVRQAVVSEFQLFYTLVFIQNNHI